MSDRDDLTELIHDAHGEHTPADDDPWDGPPPTPPTLLLFDDSGTIVEQADGCTCGGGPLYPHDSHCGVEYVGRVDLRQHDAEVAAKALENAAEWITQLSVLDGGLPADASGALGAAKLLRQRAARIRREEGA